MILESDWPSVLFGVRPAYPLWSSALHSWQSFPGLLSTWSAGAPPEKAPALLDSLEREKAFYVNILRDDICIDL